MSLTHLWHQSIHGVPIIRDVFIETGTKAGDTLWEAKDHFKSCHSIELDEAITLAALMRFNSEYHVNIHNGDSRDVLPRIINPKFATTFFLDAHCEGAPSTVAADTECPLLDELRIIVAAPWTVKPLVLIDDINMFKADYWLDRNTNHELFHRGDWPTFAEIRRLMEDHGYRYWEDPSGRIGAWA